MNKFYSRKSFKWLLVNVLLMGIAAALLLFFVLKGLDRYTQHGQAILIPEVKGLASEEATRLLEKVELKAVVSDSTYVEEALPGIVLDVRPSAKSRVKRGRIVYLTINTSNVPRKRIPDVADNSSVRQAKARILADGFQLTEDELISGERDWVYAVKYNGRELTANDQVPLGATLTLVVGDGSDEALSTDSIEIIDEEVHKKTPSVIEESWF